MAICRGCSRESELVSRAMGRCADCIRRAGPNLPLREVELRARPPEPCEVGEDTEVPCIGFADSHPANCIASWLCPGTTGCGYPKYARCPGVEAGYKNVGVFFAGCNFACPYCQDWVHALMHARSEPRFTLGEIASWVDERTTCVCFCGGNPDPYLREMIWLAALWQRAAGGGVLRFCAETNLTGDGHFLKEFAELVITSGGGFNIGLKAGSEAMHIALTGKSNQVVFENLRMLYASFGINHTVPFLRPSLLLIPGYIDQVEITIACQAIADLHPDIPFKFIRFLPRRAMTDLRQTSDAEMTQAVAIAKSIGLRRISPNEADIGRQHRFVAARETSGM